MRWLSACALLLCLFGCLDTGDAIAITGDPERDPYASVTCILRVLPIDPSAVTLQPTITLGERTFYILGHGTAFYLGDGLLATNAHVVQGLKYLVIWGRTRSTAQSPVETRLVSVVAVDERNDLAIVQIKNDETTLLPAVLETEQSPEESKGTELFYWGVGFFEEKGKLGFVKMIRWIRVVDYFDGGDILLFEPETMAGNSGSPLFNSKNHVVGVVRSNLLKEGFQGVGQAVPVAALRQLVEKVKERKQ